MKKTDSENRKFIIIIGDGMADEPIEQLGGKTPLEYAHTPNLDFLASKGIFGLVRTVPLGMTPGSDTANLSIFGYNPRKAYTGRAPLEALNMGIDLKGKDAAFRCNIVSLSEGIMLDFTADHIDSNLSKIVINEIVSKYHREGIEFYPGVSYRNIMIWRNYPHDAITTTVPPHDISGKGFEDYLPKGCGSDILNEIMRLSQEIIRESSSVAEGVSRYHGNPVSLWLWGGGLRPSIGQSVASFYGLKGCTISAVDLIHGIGRAVGLTPCQVEGVTGYLDTNYSGKADAAIEVLSGNDNFVFVHVEAPDEAGHEGNIDHKLKAIEDFDALVVGPIIRGTDRFDDCTILCMPDHPTPISIRTHSADPVPFAVYNRNGFITSHEIKSARCFSEREARETGLFVDDASTLLGSMVKGSI
jgi:2,3-bisphosphoglycerate-independent phosphoglycerate mutase